MHSIPSLVPWGDGVWKVRLDAIRPPRAKLVAVTAITPTKAGEGKTVTTIGLVDGLARIGVVAAATLRQPSLGPVFGLKGGGAGGGRARLVPTDRIDLHLTGDEHAVTAAHDLLAAFADNSRFHGNALGIDAISWPRALPMSDRALRPGFIITAASEVMAILALARDPADLRQRLGRIVVRSAGDRPITADDLRATGAMAALLRDAVLPNLVRTAEGNPAFVHAGPFANIAHGNSSILADRVAMGLSDVVVTESGFGADLGFEKLLDIKGARPDAAVIVTSVRALESHGTWEAGLANLDAARRIVEEAGVPAVVAINRFPDDTPEALARIDGVVTDAFARGGEGATDLARAVMRALQRPSNPVPYQVAGAPTRENLDRVATRVYGAEAVALAPEAEADLVRFARWGFGSLPVCVAKTQYSLSHDPELRGAPRGFTLPVRGFELAAGAGFVVALAGDIQRMPGLPTHPRGERMDLDPEGNVVFRE